MNPPQPNPLELAKQGNEHAIAFLINRSLISKGITAKTALKDGCLQVMLEAAQIPDKQTLAPFIHRGIKGLGVASVQKLKVYGRQAGEARPAWSQEFELSELSENSANKLVGKQTEQINEAQSASPASSSSDGEAKNKELAGKDKNLFEKLQAMSTITLHPLVEPAIGVLIFLIIGGLYMVSSSSSSKQSNRRTVSSADFPGEWMLTVDKGELICKAPKGTANTIVFIVPDGTEYGVNGIATSRGYADIQPIWKDNPEIPGTKINIGPLISKGLELCK